MKLFGVLSTVAGIVFGILGVLMKAAENLPPALDQPIVGTILTILGILFAGLGWLDEISSGRDGLIDLVKKFFSDNPYALLLLTAVLSVARLIVEKGDLFPSGYGYAAQILLVIAGVFSFGASAVQLQGYASALKAARSLR